jgi:hypothetical protein
MNVGREILGARKQLKDTRRVIAETAGDVFLLYQLHPSVSPGPHSPQLDRIYGDNYTVLTIPLSESKRLERYNDITISHSYGTRVIFQGVEPQKIEGMTVMFTAPDAEHSTESNAHVSMSTIGDARYNDRIVNEVPSRRKKVDDPEQILLNIRARTAEGLIIARFIVDSLDQAHGVTGVPIKRLDTVERRLADKFTVSEVVLEPGVAVLLPQAV